MSTNNSVTKDNILGKIQEKLKAGDIIGTKAYAKVVTIITDLKAQVINAQTGSAETMIKSEASVAAAEEKTRIASEKATEAGKKADQAEATLNSTISDYDEKTVLSRGSLQKLVDEVKDLRDTAAKEVTALSDSLKRSKEANDKLMAEKVQSERELVVLFKSVLTSIDDALSTENVNALINQSGGFQSSSSGNYLKKKYRSSSRSYSNRIKDLKKKRKHSKKIRRDRKEKSKRNKTKKR